MNITKFYESPLQSTSNLTILNSSISKSTPTTITTTILPGLISSLKPIKKYFLQLKEESLILNRFTYKNKNQYKSNGWWKKLIEVDRNLNRFLIELESFLLEFGIKNGTEEGNRIGSEELLAGLLRLPRSILIVEKTLSVMLKAAGIFEQLIHSKAFLSFSVVLVSLNSRLYTLSTILLEELNKIKLVLLRLISTNSLLPNYLIALKKLPPALQDLLHSSSTSSSLPSTITSTFSSTLNTPPPSLPLLASIPTNTITNQDVATDLIRMLSGGEELGQVVSRSKTIVPTENRKKVEVVIEVQEELKDESEVVMVRKKVRSIEEVEGSERAEGGGEGGSTAKILKKKKKIKKVGKKEDKDEIDDIFN